MREFLHFFGIHHWSKWSELKKIGIYTYLDIELWGGRGPKSRDILGQSRVCLICNKEQLKEIEL